MLGHKSSRLLLPITVLIGVVLYYAIVHGKPEPEARPLSPAAVPVVKVEEMSIAPQQLWVQSQGVVEPALEISLVAQVAGRVEWVSSEFANGGRFQAGDELLRIEAADYEIVLSQARSSLAEARRVLAQEKGASRQARREWRDLGSQDANDLFLRKPQLASAQASVEAAEAGLRKAQLDLERTKISAPFNGQALAKEVDIGQFVTLGTPLGKVFASDKVEVRLPVSIEDRHQLGDPVGQTVTLFSEFAGTRFEWSGKVTRVESSLDTTSRQFYLVAEIINPFDFKNSTGGSPLIVGQFLQALVPGVIAENALKIPRRALRLPGHIWLLDKNSKLQVVAVDILNRDKSSAIVRPAIPLDSHTTPLKVITSELSLAISGMDAEISPAQEDVL